MIRATDYSAPIVQVYEEIVDSLLIDLAKRFSIVSAGGASETFRYDAELLAQLGEVREEAIRRIAKMASPVPGMIDAAVEQAVLEAVGTLEPELAAAARMGYLKGAALPMREGVRKQIEAYSAQAVRQMNLVNTVMLDGTLKAYQAGVMELADAMRQLEAVQGVLNAETGKVIVGASTRQEAVRSAVRRMADVGITGYVDHGGHKWSPEAYAAMDIKTTCSNAANKAVFVRNGQYGNDLIWVRRNTTARPGCYPWQGKVIAMGGQARDVTDLDGQRVHAYSVHETTYGEPDGIFGINCHHGPPNIFIPGVSKVLGADSVPDKDANDAQYELSQKQRALERRVRYAKREAAMLDAAGDADGFAKAAQKVKQRQAEYKAFIAEHDLPKANDRLQVFGYNRSVSGKAAQAVKRASRKRAETLGFSKVHGDIMHKPDEYFRTEMPKGSPVRIPSDAVYKREQKTGYQQAKYSWKGDDGFEYTARWHTRTPEAPKRSGDAWVVERVRKGVGFGPDARPRVDEIMVGKDEWVSRSTWNKAIKARKENAETQEQREVLDNGHWKDEK